MPTLRAEESQRNNINDTSADTEFNDALIARGIIPARPPPPTEPDLILPTHTDLIHAIGSTSTSTTQLQDLADDALDSDDERLFLQYRDQRVKEVREFEQKVARVRGGTTVDGLREIGREEFVREVTEGSKVSLEVRADGQDEEEEEDDLEDGFGLPESERKSKPQAKGVGVVCFLYQNHIPLSTHIRSLLTTLCAHHPLTRFLSIRADACIPSYPDRNVPTLLLYRSGECLTQMIGPVFKPSWTAKDLEDRLVHFGVLDGPAVGLKRGGGRRVSEREEREEEDDESDVEFGTIRRGKKGDGRGIRDAGKGLGLGREDDGSDYDL